VLVTPIALLTAVACYSTYEVGDDTTEPADTGSARGALTGSEEPEPVDTADTAAVTGTREWDPDPDPEEEDEPDQDPNPGGGEWVCDKEIRNGSEICDDAGFDVPDPYQRMAIVCITGEGGVGYVSTNTGPEMSDGVPRCQGWEENGQNAWDHLDYIEAVDCTADDQVHEVDLSRWTGRGLWTGVHDQPGGGGHMTHTCIAVWEG